MIRSASTVAGTVGSCAAGSTLVRRNQGGSSAWSMRTVAGLSSGWSGSVNMTEPKNLVSSYANVSDSSCKVISGLSSIAVGVPAEIVGEVRLEVQQLPQPDHRIRVRGHPAVF